MVREVPDSSNEEGVIIVERVPEVEGYLYRGSLVSDVESITESEVESIVGDMASGEEILSVETGVESGEQGQTSEEEICEEIN